MKKALAIVDFYPTTRGGHFHSWFDKISRKALQHVDFVGVYALSETSMPLNLVTESSFENNQSDVAFFELGQIFNSLEKYSNSSKMNLIASHF